MQIALKLIWNLETCSVCSNTDVLFSSVLVPFVFLLDLPPLWWHYVLSVDQSISVNIWSVSKEQDGFDAVIQQTVKSVNSQWSLETKRHVAHYVITQLF